MLPSDRRISIGSPAHIINTATAADTAAINKPRSPAAYIIGPTHKAKTTLNVEVQGIGAFKLYALLTFPVQAIKIPPGRGINTSLIQSIEIDGIGLSLGLIEFRTEHGQRENEDAVLTSVSTVGLTSDAVLLLTSNGWTLERSS